MAGIGVLGAITIVGGDGAPVAVRSRRQRVLLAVLVSRTGQVVHADTLIDALWPAELPAHPLAALQSQVFRLRRHVEAAGARLESVGPGYRLDVPAGAVDATRFESLVARAGAHVDLTARVAMLDEALDLWRGPAYLDVADHHAVRAEADRLDELRTEAAESRAALLLRLGRPADAARAMEPFADADAFRERPVAIRMRALAAEGRHADALGEFDRFRRRLADELGLEPSPELRALESDILRHETTAAPRIGLPGNSLVGRERDLAEVGARLAASRLVTVTGPGGVGKSRLALHAAARTEEHHPDGVLLCELAAVDRDDVVAAAVATALRVEPAGEQTSLDRVVQFLAGQRALVVLDNCEHVLAGAGELAAAILGRAPDVRILATSRHRLGINGEHVVTLAPLPVGDDDDADAPAVALFVDRAASLRRFDLTEENRAAVVELCRRLDGLPLAIELAASRTVARTPVEILAEVADRIPRLGDRVRTGARHQSMDAVLAWSYERLTARERRVFEDTAVFAGGFTAEAAAAVTRSAPDAIIDDLTSLVEHSLVVPADTAGATRYSMLEPVRQYAEARLDDSGDAAVVRRRHAGWLADWLEAADAGLRSAHETQWATRIGAELANLRAAFRTMLDRDDDTAARIAGGFYWYAFWYGAPEAFEWALTVAAREGVSDRALTAACSTAALAAGRRGRVDEARELAARGIDAAASAPEAARFVWEALSSTYVMTGAYEDALQCHEHALRLARVAGDATQEAREHGARAIVLGYLGRREEADHELATATRLSVTADNPTIQAFCGYVAGELHLDTAPTTALPHLVQARDAARRIGNRYLAAIAGLSAVTTAARLGDPSATLGEFHEVLDYFHRAGSRTQQWTALRGLIETLTRVGRDTDAVILHGALSSSQTAMPLVGADAARVDDAARTLEARLGAERFRELIAEGARLGDDGAISYALRVVGPGAG